MTISQVGSALVLLSTLFFCSPAATDDAETNNLTTVAVPGGGKPVVARTDKQRSIHLLLDSADGPRYAKSTDGGTTFGPAIAVIPGKPQEAGLEYSAWDMA